MLSVMRSRYLLFGIVLVATLVVGSSSSTVQAGQTRDAIQGVYTDAQSTRGEEVYKTQCAVCHGAALQGALGPPLTGDAFLEIWGSRPLLELVNKIQNTMPATRPGTVTRQQSTDITAHIIRAAKFPAGSTELAVDDGALTQIVLAPAAVAPPVAPVASHTPSYPPVGNLGQLMRGILFPSSNLIFNVQSSDPGAQRTGPDYQPPENAGFSWVDWGAGIYSGWELIDYAGVSIADSAPLLLTPGRRCENGRPVPAERADWIQFTNELVDAGKAAYKASQSRNRDAVIEVGNQIADACLHCHEVYRDKPGGTPDDPSNKAARCVP
jgi:cytochrome c5